MNALQIVLFICNFLFVGEGVASAKLRCTFMPRTLARSLRKFRKGLIAVAITQRPLSLLGVKTSYNVIKEYMETLYNDELMPDSFEQMAKAYSQSLKNKGFVFIRLEEEEFNLLISEVFVLLSKMQACLARLDKIFNSTHLKTQIENATALLQQKFGTKKLHNFKCVEDENMAFFSLVSIQNMLTIKLMLLAIKSGEIELCNRIVASLSSVLAESFSCEGFVLA